MAEIPTLPPLYTQAIRVCFRNYIFSYILASVATFAAAMAVVAMAVVAMAVVAMVAPPSHHNSHKTYILVLSDLHNYCKTYFIPPRFIISEPFNRLIIHI
jgi:hypothetical protein